MAYNGLGGKNFARPLTEDERILESEKIGNQKWAVAGLSVILTTDQQYYGKCFFDGKEYAIHPDAYSTLEKKMKMVCETQWVSHFHLRDSLMGSSPRPAGNYVFEGVIDRKGDSEISPENISKEIVNLLYSCRK